ncbi:hypothetical protein PAE9249_02948 [Paenibacillus sp. CECT 9249]|uniref:hypothetical protein n=1 Tax=Paenibacillus sp. CECT 9249 TaxID=2845385 RepID=UPI001E4FDCE5|nr:hypothetical protein [Paenibacillus sp. CECT 9249]CAH0120429.1 hypothetical protein PAE9249_02948 [Paenibacillus sp. CECT 9249]
MKRILSLLLVAVCLVALSSSAFTNKGEITPTAIGIGDTKETALTIIPGQDFKLFIQNDQDEDWFTWTNNTGGTKFFSAHILGNDATKLRLGMEIDYHNGRESEVYAKTRTNSNYLSVPNIVIPNGTTVYVVVDSPNNVMAQYETVFRVYDYDL